MSIPARPVCPMTGFAGCDYVDEQTGIAMDRRIFLTVSMTGLASLISGCRGSQKAVVLSDVDADAVGSHEAGAETWKPLIDEAC